MTTLLERHIGHQCVAPLGGEGSAMLVCGEPTKLDASYCEAHRERFYYPVNATTLGVLRAMIRNTAKRQRAGAIIGRDD